MQPIVRSAPTVQEFMTVEPCSIAPDAPLSEAARIMREHSIRHLPVLKGGQLVGALSERDIHVARTFRSVTLETTKVETLMNDKPLSVDASTALSDVAARMIDRKVGSAIVTHGGVVVGIFTTHDGLHALHRLFSAQN